MNKVIAVAAVIGALSSAGFDIAAQQGQTRDIYPRISATGTATITGTLMTDEPNGRPVRRATVTLQVNGPAASSRKTATDDEGRFYFSGLPAGIYTALRATKPGYVASTFGEKRIGGIGVPLTLSDRQHVTVAMRMTRGAVLTGVVSNSSGKPLPQTTVQVAQVRVVNGERQPTMLGSVGGSTDDRGVFRIFGLMPGDYILFATPRSSQNIDIRPVSAQEVQWADALVAGAASMTAPRPSQTVASSPVFFPGTPDPSAATVITLGAGQEMGGLDFRTQFVPTARVEGTVIDPGGLPVLNGQITVVPKTASVAASFMGAGMLFDAMFNSRAQLSNGKLTIPALRPGDYTISIRAAPRDALSAVPGVGGRGTAALSAMSLWAMTDVTVNGVDQSGLVMQLEPGMTIGGRVAFDGNGLRPPTDLSRVNIRLTGVPSSSGVTVSVNPATAQVAADGTFALTGVTPGRYFLTASAPDAGPEPGATWQLRSAVTGGADAADTPIEVRPGQSIESVVATFTDKVAEVSGTLSDATGKPTSDFTVILLSADRNGWVRQSRRFRQPVRSGTDGSFRFTNLPAGDYYLAALADFQPSDVNNLAFLEQIIPSALKVTVTEGEKKTQNLKLASR